MFAVIPKINENAGFTVYLQSVYTGTVFVYYYKADKKINTRGDDIFLLFYFTHLSLEYISRWFNKKKYGHCVYNYGFYHR